jgi:hypothetical protein
MAEQAQWLDIIADAGSHLMSIFNTVLDQAKIEAGKLVIEQTVFSLAAVLKDACAMVAPQAHAKGLTLVFDVADVPPWVVGDPTRLRQALLNYMANAVGHPKAWRHRSGAGDHQAPGRTHGRGGGCPEHARRVQHLLVHRPLGSHRIATGSSGCLICSASNRHLLLRARRSALSTWWRIRFSAQGCATSKGMHMKFSLTHTALALSLATAVSGASATVLTVNSIVGSVDVVAAAFGGTLLDSAITVISNSSYNGVARTTATRYQAGNFGLLNGRGDNALGFAPAAVPEPSSALLPLAGLSVLGAFVWRRQGSGRASV